MTPNFIEIARTMIILAIVAGTAAYLVALWRAVRAPKGTLSRWLAALGRLTDLPK